jgi:uncharacterized membrane protein
MIQFENNIDIRQPIDKLFSFISNFENISKWNYYVLEVKKTTEGPIKFGTTFYQTRKTDSQSFKIIQYEPNKIVTIQTLPGSYPIFEIRYSFEQIGTDTRIFNEWKLELGKNIIIEKLIFKKIKKAIMENLSKMKQLLEKGNVQLQDGRIINLSN